MTLRSIPTVVALAIAAGGCGASSDAQNESASLPTALDVPPSEPTGEFTCLLPQLMDEINAVVVGTANQDGESGVFETTADENSLETAIDHIRSSISVSEVLYGEPLDGSDRIDLISYEEIRIEDEPPIMYDDVRERFLQPKQELVYLLEQEYQADGPIWRPRAAVSMDTSGDVSFVATGCANRYQIAFDDAATLLAMSPAELLIEWPASPEVELESEISVRLLEEQVRAQQSESASALEAAWNATAPRSRSLQPGDAPGEVAATLQSIPLVVDLQDIGPNSKEGREVGLGVRTETGVTLIVTLPSVIATYFTPEDETIFLDKTTDLGAPNPTWGEPVATVTTGDLDNVAAIHLSGTTDEPVVQLLSDADFTELLEQQARDATPDALEN